MRQDPNTNWEQFEHRNERISVLEFNRGLNLSSYSLIFKALVEPLEEVRPVLFGTHCRYVPSDRHRLVDANLFLVSA